MDNFEKRAIESAIANLTIGSRVLKGKYLDAKDTKKVERIVKINIRRLNIFCDGSWKRTRTKLRKYKIEWLLDTYLPM